MSGVDDGGSVGGKLLWCISGVVVAAAAGGAAARYATLDLGVAAPVAWCMR